MDSHPAAHTSRLSPRATASCFLCNPVKAAAAARLATAVWLLGCQQTARNQPESEKENGDGERAVNVTSLWMWTYSAKVAAGKVPPTSEAFVLFVPCNQLFQSDFSFKSFSEN